jgi:hypothetical protein
MKPNVSKKLKAILIFVAVLLSLAIPLMFLLEDFVRDGILLPIAYLLWLLNIIVEAIPESYFLAGIVAIGIYIALRSLGRDDRRRKKIASRTFYARGNLTLWADRLRLVARGSYSRQRFRYHLGRLALDILAHEYRMSSNELATRIREGNFEVPGEIEVYIESAVNSRYLTRQFRFQVLARLIAWLRRQLRFGQTSDNLQEIDSEIDQAVSTLQTILGMEAERGS